MDLDNDNNSSIDEENIDCERSTIRAELSTLSFEELEKLKEKIGAKVYKEALFGSKKESNEGPKDFKRVNKNRPREISSKKPVPMFQITKVKNKDVRDPRFDPLCGDFNKRQFSQDYNFLTELRIKDINAARRELKKTTDPNKEIKLRRLLQRLKDQQRDTKRSKVENDIAKRDREEVEKQFSEGKQPHFKNKSELRVEALVKQYEELKKQGTSRIQRHLKRRQQKIKKKSHKAPTGVS